jgi:hypothetical protein
MLVSGRYAESRTASNRSASRNARSGAFPETTKKVYLLQKGSDAKLAHSKDNTRLLSDTAKRTPHGPLEARTNGLKKSY